MHSHTHMWWWGSSKIPTSSIPQCLGLYFCLCLNYPVCTRVVLLSPHLPSNPSCLGNRL